MRSWLIVVVIAATTSAGWEARLAEVEERAATLVDRLTAAHETLRERALSVAPELVERLDPPRRAATGYGLLPEIRPDALDATTAKPSEQRYDIEQLSRWVGRELGRAGELATDLVGETDRASLESLIERYRRAQGDHRLILAHVRYHRLWQEDIHHRATTWEGRQRLIESYRTWRAAAAGSESHRSAQRAIEDYVLEFSGSRELAIEVGADGSCVLPITLATDIEDDAFLGFFAHAIEHLWNASDAMRRAGLTIALRWQRRSIGDVYGDHQPPDIGERIDRDRHLERFGAPFVLTTGGDSTHVWNGRGIFLGTEVVTGRKLAHEFAHLLGFRDRYLRGFEGSTAAGEGVVIIEVIPFPDDLMGSPGAGRVTDAMVERLLEVYTRRRAD